MKNKILLYILSFLLFSCEKVLPIHTDIAKQMTLNAELDTDNKIKVQLFESSLPGDSLMLQFISNATVELYENGNKISTLTYVQNFISSQSSYYGDSTIHIMPQKIYTVKATHPNFPSITATDTGPPLTTVTNVSVSGFPLYVLNRDTTHGQLQFTILDDANQHNEYVLYPFYYYSRYFRINAIDSVLLWNTQFAHTYSINGILSNNNFDFNKIDDATFNGQNKPFNLEISKLFDADSSIIEAYVGISVRQYSASFYLDKESKRQYHALLNNNIYDVPFWFYTNVIGGYGLLTCASNNNQIIAKIK